jgi:hypothetical protein
MNYTVTVNAARGRDAIWAVAHELRLQGIESTPILAVCRDLKLPDDSVAVVVTSDMPATRATWDVTVVTDEYPTADAPESFG